MGEAVVGTEDGAAESHTAQRNIETVARLEQDAARRRPPADRVATRVANRVAGFASTIGFCLAHVVLLTAWIAANTGLVPGVPVFDPYPFGLLGTLFSLEGVLLASFVLIKQARADARAEERSHLDLQISLLSEQEVTKVIQMLERISTQLGVERAVVDTEARDLGRATAVGDLAQRLREHLPPGGAT